jgi:hypothetical protein
LKFENVNPARQNSHSWNKTHGTQSGDGEIAGRDADRNIGKEFPAELDSELENEDGDGNGDNETEHVSC